MDVKPLPIPKKLDDPKPTPDTDTEESDSEEELGEFAELSADMLSDDSLHDAHGLAVLSQEATFLRVSCHVIASAITNVFIALWAICLGHGSVHSSTV